MCHERCANISFPSGALCFPFLLLVPGLHIRRQRIKSSRRFERRDYGGENIWRWEDREGREGRKRTDGVIFQHAERSVDTRAHEGFIVAG